MGEIANAIPIRVVSGLIARSMWPTAARTGDRPREAGLAGSISFPDRVVPRDRSEHLMLTTTAVVSGIRKSLHWLILAWSLLRI